MILFKCPKELIPKEDFDNINLPNILIKSMHEYYKEWNDTYLNVRQSYVYQLIRPKATGYLHTSGSHACGQVKRAGLFR